MNTRIESNWIPLQCRHLKHLMLCLVLPFTVHAQDLCLPAIGGLVAEPKMDGNSHDDVGWNGAGKLGLREHSGVPMAGAVQYGRLNNFLYMSIDNLLAFAQGTERHPGVNDTVVLTLSTDEIPANDWRIHIKPFVSSDTGNGNGIFNTHPPRAVAYWRGSTNWTLPHSSASPLPPCSAAESTHYSDCPGTVSFNITSGSADTGKGTGGGVLTNAQFVVSRQGSRWGLEMKLPYDSADSARISAAGNARLYIPASGTFKLYFDIVSTNDLHDTYVEDPWPDSVVLTPPATGSRYVENSTPPLAKWGTVTLESPTMHTACTGVQIIAAGVRDSNMVGASLGSASRPVPPSGFLGAAPYYLAEDGTHLTTPAGCQSLADNYLWSGTQSSPTGTSSDRNWFVARVSNTGTTGTTANGVSAKFYIAPWGIPGTLNTDWHLIGKLYDPDALTENDIYQSAEANISAGDNPELQTNWQLSYKQSCAYLLSNQTTISGRLAGHHCVHAELESSDRGTVFLNKSFQFNHDIVDASTATRTAEISVRGQGKPPNGSTHKMLLTVDKVVRHYTKDGDFYYANNVTTDCPKSKEKPYSERNVLANVAGDKSSFSEGDCIVNPQFREFSKIPAEYFPAGLSEGMTWIARGYLKTGNKLIIEGTEYERSKYVGGFSMEAGHLGTVGQWNLDFEGNGVGKISGNDYILSIPEEGSISVATTVTAKESEPYQWWPWLLLILVILLLLFVLLWRKP